MRILIFFIFFCVFSFNSQAINIAIFQFSTILNNSTQYKEFQQELNNFKEKIFTDLKKDEEKLSKKKIEIEDSKILLTKTEYDTKTTDFNIEKNNFELKIDKYNSYIQSNIEFNEKIILDEILIIVRNIAIEKKIDLVLNENQYYLSSDDINISDMVIQKLNKIKLNLILKDF